MTISTVQQTMIRIKGATPESPIAVFKCKTEDRVNTVFGSNIHTQKMIKSGTGFIGMFDNTMDLRTTKKTLLKEEN